MTASLDVDHLRAFTAIADLGSFTAAADMLGATQSGISVRIRKLEQILGRPVLARTPRRVELTAFGQSILPRVRELLALNDDIVEGARATPEARRVAVGLSEHAAGIHLPEILAALSAERPGIVAAVTTGLSADMRERYEAGEVDIAVLRTDQPRPDEETVFRDALVWVAGTDFSPVPDMPVPLISLPSPCRVRRVAVAALQEAGMRWTDAFTGSGLKVVHDAVACGLGIGVMGSRNVTPALRVLGAADGMPPLPQSAVVVLCRSPDSAVRALARRIAHVLKTAEAGLSAA